ncbi:hypothetical protein, partial [Saccharomonospora saliphila]|uniref:hypothetical protein n=1 Tax=Saccharomonospora saliphila TaxID=369829 RepID=UPI00037999FF
FPEAHRDPALGAAFRRRHGAALRTRLLGAVRRTALPLDPARRSGTGECVLDLDGIGVDDVLTALGHAQALFLSRPRWAALVDWSTLHTRRRGTDLLWVTACRSITADAALAEQGDETVFTA